MKRFVADMNRSVRGDSPAQMVPSCSSKQTIGILQAGRLVCCVSTAGVCLRVCQAIFSDEGNSLNQCLHFSAFMWETVIFCVYMYACVCRWDVGSVQ